MKFNYKEAEELIREYLKKEISTIVEMLNLF